MMIKKAQELDIQRQKNQDIAKHVAKTLDIKEKENKWLTDLINDLRRQIANRHHAVDKAIQMTAHSTMTSPNKSVMNYTSGSMTDRVLYTTNLNYNSSNHNQTPLKDEDEIKINLPHIADKKNTTSVGLNTNIVKN